MLSLTIPANELFDERTNSFIIISETKLQLEHSLISLSKWESKWKKPFLDETKRHTFEEMIDYARCMTITKNVDPQVYFGMSAANMKAIQSYIDDPMTATVISKEAKARINARRRKRHLTQDKEGITSELIYYWMISLQIPPEYEKWHLNRLLTLIDVCSIKNEALEKIPTNENIRRYADLNAARKKKLNTRG